MIRIARERIDDLFGVAAQEGLHGDPRVADRCVRLARKIGMRYNVRLLREYHDLYCRGCSAFWIEGRSVRTRLRSGRRVQTCLRCGRVRRVRVHAPVARPTVEPGAPAPGTFESVALVSEEADLEDLGDGGEEE